MHRASPFAQSGSKDGHEQTRIHMLYKGHMNEDIEKERSLANYQLKKAKLDKEKHDMNAQELKVANADLRKKIKRYVKLVEEQKASLEKLENEPVFQEDLNELSVTRKLGHTDMGDISDTLELGSALYKSVEDTNYFASRAHIKDDGYFAIKRQDFAPQDDLDFQRDEDIPLDRSLALHNAGPTLNLSSSLTAAGQGALNTAASVHLRQAMEEIKKQANDVNKDMSYRQLNTRQMGTNLFTKGTESSTLYGGAGKQDSLEALSKIAVQKLPVSNEPD